MLRTLASTLFALALASLAALLAWPAAVGGDEAWLAVLVLPEIGRAHV